MELTTYYTYNEFIAHYQEDLDRFKKRFPDAEEEDFKQILLNKYGAFFWDFEDLGVFQFTLGIPELDPQQNIVRNNMPVEEFVKMLNDRIYCFSWFGYNLHTTELYEFMGNISDDANFTKDNWLNDYFPFDKNYIPMESIEKVLPFVKTGEDYFLPKEDEDGLMWNVSLLELDKNKIKNFEFAVRKILRFLNSNNAQQNEAEDLEESAPEKFTVPQKVKILDELNIRGWLEDKGYTVYQIEQLLSDLFERTDKSIRNAFANKKHENIANNYLEELRQLKAGR